MKFFYFFSKKFFSPQKILQTEFSSVWSMHSARFFFTYFCLDRLELLTSPAELYGSPFPTLLYFLFIIIFTTHINPIKAYASSVDHNRLLFLPFILHHRQCQAHKCHCKQCLNSHCHVNLRCCFLCEGGVFSQEFIDLFVPVYGQEAGYFEDFFVHDIHGYEDAAEEAHPQ